MSFASLLREIVESCRGGLGAALLGNDGMPIEQVVAEAAPETLAEPGLAPSPSVRRPKRPRPR